MAECDTYEEVIRKISNGIKAQTNQAMEKYKLFCLMEEGRKPFHQWYLEIKEQADRINWDSYDAECKYNAECKYDVEMVARDMILDKTEVSKFGED